MARAGQFWDLYFERGLEVCPAFSYLISMHGSVKNLIHLKITTQI